MVLNREKIVYYEWVFIKSIVKEKNQLRKFLIYIPRKLKIRNRDILSFNFPKVILHPRMVAGESLVYSIVYSSFRDSLPSAMDHL